MTRKFLANLGVTEDEIITKILNAHQDTVQSLKDDLEKAKGDLKAVKDASDGKDWKAEYEAEAKAHAATKEAAADIDALKQQLTEVKKLHAEEVKAHKATQDGYAAEKDSAETASLVRANLEKDGANKKMIDLLQKEVDVSAVQKKDGTIVNWDDLAKPIREKYSDFFGEVTTKGADVGTPPAGKTEADPFSAGFDGK